jgi:hypothetical protein
MAMPPYPEVWEKVLPVEVDSSRLGVSLLDDGEVLITIAPDSRTGPKTRQIYTFFNRKAVDLGRTARETNAVVYADGTRAAIVRRQGSNQEMSDGRTIRISSNAYRGCYRGPARQSVALVDGEKKERLNRVFFYLLSEPEQFTNDAADTASRCPTEEQMTLRTSVVSLDGAFLPLPDGTVLFVVPSRAIVLRLDSSLESRSRLMNDKIFSFPIATGDYLFLPKTNGKNYGSGEMKNIRFQELLDDLKAHLELLRREE